MRYLVALICASGVVFALFMLMDTLVKGAKWKPENIAGAQSIDFVRLKREETVAPKERRLPQRPPEPESPPPPRAKLDQALAPSGPAIDVSAPKVDTSFRGNFSNAIAVFDSQTSAVIPLARVEPQYPPAALAAGTEGWVEVEFTITAFGTVESPRVVESSPRGVFENAALRAIARWKFKPKIEDGVAVAAPGARYRLEFTMAKDSP